MRAGCELLVLADVVDALLVVEHLVLPRQHLHENSGPKIVHVFLVVLGTVAEQILLRRVAVEVEEEFHLASLLLQQLDEVYQSVDLGVEKFANLVEFTIEIPPAETCSVVACDYPVRVYHRYDVELAARQQSLRCFVL